MAAEHAVGGSIFLALSASSLVFGGDGGPFSFPLADLGWASMFVFAGAVARAALDAKEARAEARRLRLPMPPGLDGASLAYALLAAPMMGAMTLASVKGLGFVPDNMAVPALMGFGYWGRDGVDWILDLAKSVITRKVDK